MTSFHETRFPEDIAYGSGGGPEYATDIVITQGGYERRNINWTAARARYNVAYGVKTQEQLASLIAFFRARKGRAYGFRFKDWTDYSGASEVIGTGDGSTVAFQLTKTYTSGEGSEVRHITKPVSGSVKVYLDDVQQSSGWSVDTTTGVITFDVAPGADVVVTAGFEFDVPVRFDTDRLSALLQDYGSYALKAVQLIEVR